ncbi:MAG: HAD family hydrolase [Defluviitaleaceae bacterium]|nr:HAD family hydrolase [Defluviitaleaceae bacterium]MCL2274828.1 HAD family hydrolase [Defluviitaleaceae bacterium]
MKLQHIIFDLDGTLSATAQATALAIETARKTFNYLPAVTEAQIKDAMGLHGIEFHKKLFAGVDEEKLRPVEKAIDDLELENITKLGRAILFDGVWEMLEALKARGCTMYIASTGNDAHVHGTLDATGMRGFFASVSCNKPQKIGMVREILNGASPANWGMVGDMFKDSEAAKGNGISALGAEFGYLAEADKKLFDVVLKTPNDILQYAG